MIRIRICILLFREPGNRFQGINSARICILAGRYDNPISTRFLAPIDCLKIPAQVKENKNALILSFEEMSCFEELDFLPENLEVQKY
jgi:hypothetical protein